MREYALFRKDWPLLQCPFLSAFEATGVAAPDDPLVAEASLHYGLRRDDADGMPPAESFDATPLANRPESLRTAQRAVTSVDIKAVKQLLRGVGYYVGDDDNHPGPEFLETIRIFQTRWKKRSSKGFVQAATINGELDAPTLKLINNFARFWDRI